ncbi:uroporphyrinogen-III synthase [Microbacterium terricola]|uniref:Uroporphyrinogen-III synthase n=1 Tax=Microbacterium terricola TaxID=344163 RepID=A0ABM8DZ09_9MICO|nr:uroporphyrinogen-III synthase [Microbacterium terricola]UYK41377.1 uroporphyrinogen-III synthase [Microbacterium terricola]BDV30839.1 uroporphyrinogen-III synthase [Microbacterium terricola]
MTARIHPPISAALEGCTVVIAVDRRAGELSAALERHGATVRQAPALTIVPHIDDEALIDRTRELILDPPEIVVATTGVGFRGWMGAADEAGLADELHAALSEARIVARGPKARGAIQQAGLTADWVAESETSRELGEFLVAEGLGGRRVAVQHHGSGADGLDELFDEHGADVVSLTVYRWGPPPDAVAVSRSVVAASSGEVDAVLFTSAPGAAEWLAAAHRQGVLEPLLRLSRSGRLLMAAVGPITAEPIRAVGIEPLVAERGRLGALVRSVVTHYGGGHAPAVDTTAGRLELRSSGAVLDGRFIPLSRTGVDILSALFAAAGGVVSRAHLQHALPRPGENTHAVDMAIARVREALGAAELIKTVVKRGYRLDVLEPVESSW